MPEHYRLVWQLTRIIHKCRHALACSFARNHPPYDVSAMDGYAVRYSDITAATPDQPVSLMVVDNIRAGSMPQVKVLPGKTARIMTGAPTPQGVDTVIRVEDTDGDFIHRRRA